MKKQHEMIMLFNFKDEEYKKSIVSLLEKLNIKVVTPENSEFNQRVGYVFGLHGFTKAEPSGDIFEFGYELMMFLNFTQERLMKVLANMREENIVVPVCKSVVTPTNRFWTIERVCHAMEKEHLSMMANKSK